MAEKVVAFDPAAAVAEKKKWRMPQDYVDIILSLDSSEYVPRAADNIDHLSVPQELKDSYRATMLQSTTDMREVRRSRREMQEWVRGELEKNGFVQIETTSEHFAKLQNLGFVEIETAKFCL